MAGCIMPQTATTFLSGDIFFAWGARGGRVEMRFHYRSLLICLLCQSGVGDADRLGRRFIKLPHRWHGGSATGK